MQFNSAIFITFLPIVFILFWFVINKNLKLQNLLLVISSYIFYGWWDWRFLSLIFFSSIVDFSVGIGLSKAKNEKHRRTLLAASLLTNIGLLAFFKYYNFFIDNFIYAFSSLGYTFHTDRLSIILPIGISFYTFQTLSYSIDVYKRKLEPTKDFIAFLAFVSFFPQLVAGPIERATYLLPQFFKIRIFDATKAVDGMRQILWGFFKKIVIADNCALYVNAIFQNHTTHSGSTLLLGATFFAFQIYGDFSGYSDIAIGVSRLFGINLKKNFAFPYFSRDIAEFWRRWHISLSTWFRDYVYIPLGGSQCNNLMKIRNVFIIFILSGFWHGANWTFIVWGALNAVYFLPLILMKSHRKNTNTIAKGRLLPSIKNIFQVSFTFSLTLIAWIFFRSKTVGSALIYISRIFSPSLFSPPKIMPMHLLLILFVFTVIEWLQREKEHGLQILNNTIPRYSTWLLYYIILTSIYIFSGQQQTFIYFQF